MLALRRSSLLPRLATAPLLLTLAACDCDDCDDHPPPPAPNYVSITVEVYDPATNLVWQNVDVRIVEADQEWANATYVSPVNLVEVTDTDGIVFFDEFDLAAAAVGFLEDENGLAVIWPDPAEDEATVWIEISAPGFVTELVDVRVDWDTPDVFVSVPFVQL